MRESETVRFAEVEGTAYMIEGNFASAIADEANEDGVLEGYELIHSGEDFGSNPEEIESLTPAGDYSDEDYRIWQIGAITEEISSDVDPDKPPRVLNPDDDTFSPQNQSTTTNGGDNEMTEVDTSYFEEQGRYALESLGEDPEDYDDEEIVEHGIAAELWLTENGQSGEFDRKALVGFATEEGYLDGMMEAKRQYQETLDPEGLYDEVVSQTEDRAETTDRETVLVNQLSYFADRMAEGTERVAQAHERTEETYERAQRALNQGFQTIDTVVDRVLSAREAKGLETESPEDLNREMVYRAVLDQSVEDASNNLEALAEEDEVDWDELRALEKEGENRVTMIDEIDSLEEDFRED
ncbi:MAG: hypothetical protein ABEK16_01545 [Candidatus Nanohalobium sp.]